MDPLKEIITKSPKKRFFAELSSRIKWACFKDLPVQMLKREITKNYRY